MNELLTQIIGKNRAGVEAVLGKMNHAEVTRANIGSCKERGCLKGFFGNGRYEVVFIDGVADWITLKNIDSLVAPDFVRYWGLMDITPSFANKKSVVSYKNVHGMEEIELVSDGKNNIAYILLKAFTTTGKKNKN